MHQATVATWRARATSAASKTRRAARRQGVRYSLPFMRAGGTQVAEITKPIGSAILRPIVDRTDRLDEAPQSLAHVGVEPSSTRSPSRSS